MKLPCFKDTKETLQIVAILAGLRSLLIGATDSVISNLRTGPDQLPKIRTDGPDHYINCCKCAMHMAMPAPSKQIPIFFPNYHVQTVTGLLYAYL